MIALLLLLATAHAERPLTARECLEAAVQHSPSLVQARLSESEAEASLLGARGTFDPSLAVEGTWSRSNYQGFFQGFPFESESRSWSGGANLQGSLATGTSYGLKWDLSHERSRYITDFGAGDAETSLEPYRSNLQLTVTQQLLKGHRLAYNLQHITNAQDSLDQAALTAERTRQQTLADTASAYWSWAYQVELRRIAEDAVAVAEEGLRVGRLKLDAGELAPLEVTRLEAARIQARSQAMEAEQAERQAADALLLLMGESPGQDILPATEPGEVPVMSLDADAAVEVALAQNLDLALARARADSARSAYSLATHALLPSLAVTGAAGVGAQNMETAPGAVGDLFGEDGYPSYSASGNLSLPIGNRAARGDRKRTLHALHGAELEAEATERSVQSQVAVQVRTLAASREKVDLADANLRLAEQTLRAEEALADAGRKILKDLLDARQSLASARAEAARARTEYRLAQAELLRLQGQLDVEAAAP